MIRQAAFLLLRLAFLLGFFGADNHSASAGDRKAPGPITKPGEYKLFHGNTRVKVAEEKGLLTYEVRITVIESATELSYAGLREDRKLKKENAVWVIYPESKKSIWIFWGDGSGAIPYSLYHLYVIEKDGVAKGKEEDVHEKTPARAIATMPKAMAEALPKEFVAKYKGK